MKTDLRTGTSSSLESTRSALGRTHTVSWSDAAYASVCVLAFALPTDYIVAVGYADDPGARMPSVFAGMVAAVLCLPKLAQQLRFSRRFAPVLLVSGSMLVGVLTLALLALTGGTELNRSFGADRPLKLALMGILFVLAASEERWRGRLLLSYVVGWAAFVVYALYTIVSGRADVVEHHEIARTSIAGLDQNSQSVLVATGIIVVLAEMVQRRLSFRTIAHVAALLAGASAFLVGVSRSATLALVAGGALVALGGLRGPGRLTSRTAKLAAVLALLGGGGAVLLARSELVSEALTGLGQRFEYAVEGTDTGSRGAIASKALELALKNPWHGVGFSRARVYLGSDPHNGYLRIVAEGGALAAALLLAGLILALWAVLRSATPGPRLGPAAALVVVMIWAAAGQGLVEVPFWFFLALVSADAARPSTQ